MIKQLFYTYSINFIIYILVLILTKCFIILDFLTNSLKKLYDLLV